MQVSILSLISPYSSAKVCKVFEISFSFILILFIFKCHETFSKAACNDLLRVNVSLKISLLKAQI